MKLSILRRMSDYRGDHSADISVAYDHRPDETLESMVRRVFGPHPDSFVSECIEVRVVVEPKVTR